MNVTMKSNPLLHRSKFAFIALGIASTGLLAAVSLSAQQTFTWNAHAVDWNNPAHWTPAGGPPGSNDDVIFNPTPAQNAIILSSNLTVRNFSLNGGAQFTQIGTSSGGARKLTVNGDFIHNGSASNVVFRGSTGGNKTDVLAVHIRGNLKTSGGQPLDFGQHRSDERFNYALNGLRVDGTTTIDNGGIIRLFTNGTIAQFGEVVLGSNGRNALLLNHGTADDAFGSQFPAERVVEVAGLSGGNGGSTRIATSQDRQHNAGKTVLRLTGDGTYRFDGQIVNRADGSVGNSIIALEKRGSGVQILTHSPSVWGGRTAVMEGGLLIDGAHNGRGADYTIDYGAWLGGRGTISLIDDHTIPSAKVHFAPGAKLVFEEGQVLTLNSNRGSGHNRLTVDLSNLLPQDLVQRDGSPLNWRGMRPGTYPVLAGTAHFENIQTEWDNNIGGSGKDARFRADGNGLTLEVVAGSGHPAQPRTIDRQPPRPIEVTTSAAVASSASAQAARPQTATIAPPPSRRPDPTPAVETSVRQGAVEVVDAIDWPDFIGAHDLVWTVTPKQWNEGGFTGNGQLGIMAYATLDDNRFDFHIGRTDVTDHRGAPERRTSFGVPRRNVMFDFPRLELGRMALRPAGKIESVIMRQYLWNAELRGTIKTDLGELQFRVITHRDEMLHTIDVISSERNADGSQAQWRWEFLPGNPDSPRFQIIGRERAPDYQHNPRPVLLQRDDDIRVVEQRLLAGGCYATAWKQIPLGENRARLLLTTANEYPPAGSSAPVAVETIQRNSKADFEAMVEAHRDWWHAFYQRSFLGIPDPRLESFYWIQLYKFGAAARAGGPPVDLFGPWFKLSIWPGMWWNTNVQKSYWLPVMANHLDLSGTLIQKMDDYWQGLLNRFHKTQSQGDLAWVLHNYWLHYRHQGDWNALAEKWLPKATDVLEGYTTLMEEGPDGRLHLKPMGSPEFQGFKPFRNTNYNLALLRWLVRSVNEVNVNTGAGAALAAEWSAKVERLIDPPVDEHGFMIGSDQSVDESQRHHSHLIGFYPLFIFDDDDPEMYELLRHSTYHWLLITNPDGRRDRTGFAQAIAASTVAALGDGNEAVDFINGLLDNNLGNTIHGSMVLPNTFYMEANGLYPTIESPLAASSATIEMVLQSWRETVRVFPAVPDAWDNVRFHNLRAEGGFLVSAERRNGRTAWVMLESTAGEPLTVRVRDWDEPVVAQAEGEISIRSLGSGDFVIDLKQGERVLLSPAASPVTRPVLHAHPRTEQERHFYGVRPDNRLKENRTHPKDIPLRIEQ